MTELWAYSLTWAEVDPLGHPFELDEDAARALAECVAPLLPRADTAKESGRSSLDPVTDFLVERYGRWARGWNWSVGEGDTDGGVVGVWCCASHSVTTADETSALVVAALLEWRDWLEELAERFAALAPPKPLEDPWHWERACARLVTVVADRTQAESGWYRHCMQVLTWFLTRNGIPQERAREIVESAVGGRFDSWVAPDATVVDSVSSRFAQTVEHRA